MYMKSELYFEFD